MVHPCGAAQIRNHQIRGVAKPGDRVGEEDAGQGVVLLPFTQSGTAKLTFSSVQHLSGSPANLLAPVTIPLPFWYVSMFFQPLD